MRLCMERASKILLEAGIFFICVLSVPVHAFSFEVDLSRSARIESFSRGDLNFRQLQSSVRENDRLYFAQKETFPEFFLYVCGPRENFLTLAASTGIPYDTLSTLNSISDVNFRLEGVQIVIPSVKGLFVPESPENSVELLLYKEYEASFKDAVLFTMNGKKFFFFEGKRFSPYQRLFFLDSAFNLPLDTKVVSSGFGMRRSPVYGTWRQHNGIDFASGVGEKVYACKNGTVSFVKKNDSVLGDYIELSHAGSLTSVYAHLSRITVRQGDIVRGGEQIGETGSSGMSTGPHLHFEIRRGGRAIDPISVLP